jgi:hypothetical protein
LRKLDAKWDVLGNRTGVNLERRVRQTTTGQPVIPTIQLVDQKERPKTISTALDRDECCLFPIAAG